MSEVKNVSEEYRGKVEELTRKIGERIERFRSAGILEEGEARTLETLREHLYDEALTNEKAIEKLKAMNALLEMAEKHKEPVSLTKDDYSDLLLHLRTIDPTIRPSGDAFLEVHAKEPKEITPEAYKPGVIPLHEEEIREINHETLGRFVRLIRRFRGEPDEEGIRREALRILAELATHGPFDIKADEKRMVVRGLALTPFGINIVERGFSGRPIQPYYPSDNIFRVLESIHRGSEEFIRALLSGGLTPELILAAKRTDEMIKPWRELFETYRQMKRRGTPAKVSLLRRILSKLKKEKETNLQELALEDFLRFQAKIIADNVKTFSQVRNIPSEAALGLVLEAIGKSIIAHHIKESSSKFQEKLQKASTRKQRKKLEKEMNEHLEKFTKEVQEYLEQLHRFTLEELKKDSTTPQ